MSYQNMAISQKLVLAYTVNVNMLPAWDPERVILGGFYSADTQEVLMPSYKKYERCPLLGTGADRTS